ncbi:MAG: hypothetical protein AB7R89_08695 [Dehalococcoidia bacterium]
MLRATPPRQCIPETTEGGYVYDSSDGGGDGGWWIDEPEMGCGGGHDGEFGGGGLSYRSELLAGWTMGTADRRRDGRVAISFTVPVGSTP